MALALRLSADQILARIPKTSMSIASDTSHRSIPIELLRIRFAKYLLKQRFKYPGRSFTRLQHNVINTVTFFCVVFHLNFRLQYRHTNYLEIYIKEVSPSYLLYLPSSCLDTITHFHTKMLEGRDYRVSVQWASIIPGTPLPLEY